MAEYIERESAKKEFNLNFGSVSHAVIANRILDSIPTADVAPVVHGRWDARIMKDIGTYTVYWCSECNNFSYYKHNYCPNCGARMDGE